jgi:hypothetical protein
VIENEEHNINKTCESGEDEIMGSSIKYNHTVPSTPDC